MQKRILTMLLMVVMLFTSMMCWEVNVNAQEATILYLGILIDTNRFKARTGARTFEACATLRQLGVEPNEAEDLINIGAYKTA